MIERGYFSRALQIVLGDPITYLGGTLLLLLLSSVTAGLLIGPAICGVVWITLKHCRGERVEFADLLRGFDRLGSSVAAGIVFCLPVAAGLAAFILPGIILGSLFCFVFAFIVDRNMPLPAALAASRDLLGEDGGDLLDRCIFFLLVLLVGISGAVLLVAGLLFTWPLMWAVVAVAYHDLIERAPAASSDLPED